MKKSTSANLGFEEKLWATADKMRNNMDPSEYKHVVLGLIFLKYISDSFEELHEKLKADKLSDPEDKDEYLAENVFWVPQEARWNFLLQNAKKAEIGKLVDDAMVAIEKENPSLKGVLPKDYARPTLDKQRLGELIDLIGTIGLGDKESRSKDVLGRVYEYFIGRFASAEGKGGGEFFTPASVVQLLVYMIEPFKGRVFDPCCGSGGMFVQSEKFIENHGGRLDDVAIFGQESNATTWRLCKMNLAIRGIESKHILLGDSFHNDQHKDLKADFILANPPFNISDWGGERLREDVRWKYGTPPTGNANYGWIQHFIHHLSPTGIAGFVMANGALGSNQSEESQIRRNIIKAGLVDCIVALPPKLFYTTPVSASLWILSRDRYDQKFRDRHGEILFIDAQQKGELLKDDRNHKELTEKDIQKISETYHNWRNVKGNYKDEMGFCRAVDTEVVEKNDYVLIPGRYIEATISDNHEDIQETLNNVCKKINKNYQESLLLEELLNKYFKKFGYAITDTKFLVAQTKSLEEIGQVLYRNWFIKFDFPDKYGKPYKSNGGEMWNSEKGEMPAGWRIGSLTELMDISGGTQPPASEFKDCKEDGYIRLVQIRDYDTDEHITYIPDTHKLRKCTSEDIMIARYGAAVGRILSGLDGAYNVALVKVIPKEKSYREYLRFYLNSEEFQSRLRSMSGRSAQAGFNKNDLASFNIPIAPLSIYQLFDSVVGLIMKKILINRG